MSNKIVKLLNVLLFLLSFNLLLSANDTIKVEYKYLENRELADIAGFLGMEYRKIIITGDIKGRNFITFTHVVKDGKDSIRLIDTSYFPMGKDTLQIIIKTLSIDDNKVKIGRDYGRWSSRNIIFEIGDNGEYASSVLMETALGDGLKHKHDDDGSASDYYLTTLDNMIPIVAYSPGIPIEVGGEIWRDFCGLRDAGIHPSLWVEKFEIKNYLYFDIKFLERTSITKE